MTRISSFVVKVLSVLVVFTGATAFAQSASFLKINGVVGESDTVPGAIDLQSYTFNVRGGPAGRAQFGDFTFVAAVSKASPVLMFAVAGAQHFPTATISVLRTDLLLVEFVRITLTDVIITSYQPQPGDIRPNEQFTVAYGRIQFDYWVINPDGSQGEQTTRCWDVRINQRC
jgi:type VI protein secretion system component Hcp